MKTSKMGGWLRGCCASGKARKAGLCAAAACQVVGDHTGRTARAGDDPGGDRLDGKRSVTRNDKQRDCGPDGSVTPGHGRHGK